MTLIHIYDGETGRYRRSQEPVIDVLASELAGVPIYVEYANSTTEPLPEFGEHECPFWVVPTRGKNKGIGRWEVKGQYKNVEVYDKDTKAFTYCATDELGANQLFIDDKEGIEKFKADYKKYIVNEKTCKIEKNPDYFKYVELQELEEKLANTDKEYEEFLNTPVVFPATGKLYKPVWVDDGTYAKLLSGCQAGLFQFPQDIWDATKLEENKVRMNEEVFKKLCLFLSGYQAAAFTARKEAQSLLLAKIAEKKAELGIED